jgi:hypothetical protein
MKSRLFVLPVMLVLLAARSASAQSRESRESRDPYVTDFSLNYDAVYHETGATSNLGAHFDVASTFNHHAPFIGPVGEVGINHFNGGNVVSALGGLRLRSNVDRLILPFVQVVAGLYHCGVCGANDFGLQGGGGVDFGRRDNTFRIRAQVDVRRVFSSPVGFNGVRFSLGVVLPLNK